MTLLKTLGKLKPQNQNLNKKRKCYDASDWSGFTRWLRKGYNGRWMQCAFDVVTNNRVHLITLGFLLFVDEEKDENPLTFPRLSPILKNRLNITLDVSMCVCWIQNIIIVGPSSCGKSFFSGHLQVFCNAFCYPSVDKYV